MPVVERVRQLRTLESPPVDAFLCPLGPTEFTNVQLQEADVLDLESLSSEGTNYNLVSASCWSTFLAGNWLPRLSNCGLVSRRVARSLSS